MHDSALQGLQWLEMLSIYMCQLKEAPVISWVCSTLQYLRLDFNDISYLPEDYFVNCSQMKHVYFNQNFLHQMPNFEPIRLSLEVFYGDNNEIESCNSLCDFAYPKMRDISLSWNKFSQLPDPRLVRTNWPSLKHLYMAYNNLSTLPDLTTILPGNTTRMIYIFLDGNPFHCDADLAWLAEKYEGTPHGLNYNGFYMQTQYAYSMECRTPDYLRGAPIYYLDLKYFDYDNINQDKETVSDGNTMRMDILVCITLTYFSHPENF